ncbi:hypothetical protein ACFVYR_16350 [Streptomyces sp. NPDC058284]|uniref:hypothetical protein n=1 Tax=unclassified Streptomyces TaxID=2593676 RepID=UPI00365DB5F4
MRGIWTYWGYVAAAALVLAWGSGAATAVIVVLSLAVVAYATFQLPVWCGAVNRNGSYCRRNASGILMGCNLRQHRWQKMKMVVLRSKAGDFSRAVFPSAKEKFGAFIAVGGLASAVAAVIVPVMTG